MILTRKIIVYLALFAASAANSSGVPPYLDDSLPAEQRVEDALSRMTLDEKIALIHAQSKFSTPGCPRLGIPELWMSDGPHGVRVEFDWDEWKWAGWTNDSCTAMPALTCLAATFNPALAERYGNVVGEEARFRKKDVILGPGVNIYRTPLSGRNFEYMGEDPLLASRMVVPYIRGVQRNGVSACLKHFALNNQENNRDAVNVAVGERALNEIYLPAFRAGVVEGGVWTVMGSYNKYKGTYCTHNDTLVNQILKKQWGFDGAFITDWGSAHDTREAALNGLDIEMGSWTNGLTWGKSNAYDDYYMAEPLKALVKAGEIDEKLVDDKARRVLRLCLRTNMDRSRPWGSMHTPEHLATAREVGREGIVLLKNQHGALPLREHRRIAVIGENAVKSLTMGGGSSELKPRVEITPLDGLRQRFGADNIDFSLGYASGEPNYSRELPSPYDADSLLRAAIETARRADEVIFIGGLNKNYRQDCEGEDRLTYDLPFGQNELIEAIVSVNPRTTVVIVSGNAVAMPWESKVPAIVQSWYLGSMGGAALADILSGDANPSGKLPFSIPVKLSDCAAHSFGQRGYPGVNGEVSYDEGLLVGYRWHDTRRIPARYPFGHGLSYTTFKYSALATDRGEYLPTDTVTVTMRLENNGNLAGAECVQFYASQKSPRLERPAKELKAFSKTMVLPGEKTIVTARIPVASLAYYDDSLHRWVVDRDEFTILAGSSSTDIRAKVSFRTTDSESLADAR
ncbi:MAG: glycoside hydrolase family 3 C-terminal domain-containing protein [Alistipes timonensis]|nr:glycoside hydrolase family 3 C-terminal domain-containing protein [Alistipes timonensis]